MDAKADLRPSPIAGTWYEGSPQRLRAQVNAFLENVPPAGLTGEVIGLIAPHAGHRYSGQTAAYAYATVVGKSYDVVVVLSPMHSPAPAAVLTTAHQAYTTPLGPVWVEQETMHQLETLLAEKGLALTPVMRDQEHSLEIQLPFLQCALGDGFQLLPVMVHSLSPVVAEHLGRALVQVLQGRSVLLVASTDLSHFYPQPQAERFDQEMLARMQAFNPSDLFQAERSGKGFACGVAAVAAALWAARGLGANQVKILHHSTSGDETGDFSSVVGYGAAAILKNP